MIKLLLYFQRECQLRRINGVLWHSEESFHCRGGAVKIPFVKLPEGEAAVFCFPQKRVLAVKNVDLQQHSPEKRRII